jgi:molybdate transport system permease protein
VDWQALGVSVRLAFTTAAALFLIGVPLAGWLAFTRHRVSLLIESFLMLPFVLPPTVLGFYLLIALAPSGYAFTFTAVLVGTILINLPIAVQAFVEAFQSVDKVLIEGHWSLGATRLQTFMKLVIPLSWPGILSGMALAFAHTFGEFGVAMMVGGNVRGATRTMSIAIYDSVQSLQFAQARQTALVQLTICFILLVLITLLRRRVRGQLRA